LTISPASALHPSETFLTVKSKMTTTALLYVLGVVICWGLYSVFLHMGSMGMSVEGAAPDPMASRMKAFLLVGIAYFIVAVVAPLLILKARDAGAATHWSFPSKGWTMSLVAGLLGAFGAFFLLMALSSDDGNPANRKVLIAMVPTLVFAGAPLVNAVVSVTKEGLWAKTPPQFFIGLLLAAAGAGMVMLYKPGHGPAKPQQTPPAKVSAAPAVAPGYADVTTRRYHVS
jgi:drug/metabolite transporter (DMT)-like permease